MINFKMFIEGLLIPLLGLGVFVVYERSKRKKRKFHASPTINYLINWIKHLSLVIYLKVIIFSN